MGAVPVFVGDRTSLLAFKAMGFETYPVRDKAEAEEVLRKIAGGSTAYAAVFITEELARDAARVLSDLEKERGFAVTVIPGAGGSRGVGAERFRAIVRRAIGAELK